MLSKYQYLTFPSLPESLLTLPTCLKVACSCCMRGSKTYCEWKSDWSNAVSNADGVVAFSKKIVLQLNAAAALVGVHVKQMRPHGTIRLYYIHSSLTYIANFIVDGHVICQLFHNICKKKAPFLGKNTTNNVHVLSIYKNKSEMFTVYKSGVTLWCQKIPTTRMLVCFFLLPCSHISCERTLWVGWPPAATEVYYICFFMYTKQYSWGHCS